MLRLALSSLVWCLGLVLSTSAPVMAQTTPLDTTRYELPALEVSATPFALSAEGATFALSAEQRSEEDVATIPALTMSRLAYGVPGLWIGNRENASTGERILVRGLGWRAQFGVRGVQIVLDGVPLTAADGQSVLDVVDPAFLREIEVIRGPASVFWGNSSGGVVHLSTRPALGAPTVAARHLRGAYGLAKTDAQVWLEGTPGHLHVYGSTLQEDGYRDHSARSHTRAGLRGQLLLSPTRRLDVVGALARLPEVLSPGGIDAEAVSADPQQTRDIAVTRNAGKDILQAQLGLTYTDETAAGQLRATVYGLVRRLDNAIIPRFIDLNRRAGGLRLTLDSEAGRVAWGAGLEGKVQRDDRQEFGYDTGSTPSATPQTDQDERVDNVGVFGRGTLDLAPLFVSAGLRYDRLFYEADDRLGTGDGSRTLDALSPSVGVLVQHRQGQLYLNGSGSLEAPTTTELGNRPDGSGGFNLSLEPERIWSVEAGGRGYTGPLSYDLATFALFVDDLLLPFEVDDITFFRNEGRTRHLGGEAAFTWQVRPGIDVVTAYTYTRATFVGASESGVAVDGNAVPGVPEHLFRGVVTARRGPLTASLEAEAVSAYPVDSANTAENDRYGVLHARLSARLPIGTTLLLPIVALNNVFDTAYSGAVVVNAFGGRYYEPAAERHLQVGLALQWR
ncbi:MAG: TonB-dependent receptor [Bacteroidota bacterium]